jgi:release factor glutamine methyltransferase
MYKLVRAVVAHTMKPYLSWYLRKDRGYTFKGINLIVKAGVFHPGFFFSTKYLLNYLERINLRGHILELGAGSGLISIHLAKKGLSVTASDINPAAIEGLKANSQKNNVWLEVIKSNLFQHIPAQHFDFIIINPPYFYGDAKDTSELAWRAGKTYDYFTRLFASIGKYIDQSSKIIMVLSEDCDIERISEIALKNGFDMVLKDKKRIVWELNFIFEFTFLNN